MSTGFPPCPDKRYSDQLAKYLQVLSCAIPPRSAHYVAAPITTGSRFLDWHKAVGGQLDRRATEYETQHKAAVVRPNVEAVLEWVASYRQAHPAIVVIEPASLDVPGLDQSGYRWFWGEVVRRFAKRIIVLDGWHLSSGAAYEVLVALGEGHEVLTQSLTSLNRANCLIMLESGQRELQGVGASVDFLEAVISELRRNNTQ